MKSCKKTVSLFLGLILLLPLTYSFESKAYTYNKKDYSKKYSQSNVPSYIKYNRSNPSRSLSSRDMKIRKLRVGIKKKNTTQKSFMDLYKKEESIASKMRERSSGTRNERLKRAWKKKEQAKILKRRRTLMKKLALQKKNKRIRKAKLIRAEKIEKLRRLRARKLELQLELQRSHEEKEISEEIESSSESAGIELNSEESEIRNADSKASELKKKRMDFQTAYEGYKRADKGKRKEYNIAFLRYKRARQKLEEAISEPEENNF